MNKRSRFTGTPIQEQGSIPVLERYIITQDNAPIHKQKSEIC